MVDRNSKSWPRKRKWVLSFLRRISISWSLEWRSNEYIFLRLSAITFHVRIFSRTEKFSRGIFVLPALEARIESSVACCRTKSRVPATTNTLVNNNRFPFQEMPILADLNNAMRNSSWWKSSIWLYLLADDGKISVTAFLGNQIQSGQTISWLATRCVLHNMKMS